MKIPFIVYIRAVGIYALLTIPALVFPIMYVVSIIYVLFYGWFAWAMFTMIYIVTVFCNPSYTTKLGILTFGVVISVLVAFQMLEVLGVEQNIWQSGGFLLFPLAAVFSGWISLYRSRENVRSASRNLLLDVLDDGLHQKNNSH